MTNDEVDEYLRYRGMVKFWLSITGIWPIDRSYIIYQVLPFIPLALNVLIIFFIFQFVRDNTDSIPLVITGMSVMTSYLTTTLKMTCLIVHRKDLSRLHKALDEYLLSLLNKSDNIKIILANVSIFRRLTCALITTAIFTCLFWIIVPLYGNAKQYFRHIQPVHYSLVFPASYPWRIPQGGIRFQLQFVYESISGISLLLISLSADTLFPYYVFLVSCQLQEMSHTITHIGNDSDGKKEIRQCVIQYCNLVNCGNSLERIFGPIILWTTGANSIVLCTVVFQITQMGTVSKWKIFSLAVYVSIKVVQAFLYAFSGSCFTAASECYRKAVYDSKWYKNEYLMNSMVIMLIPKPLVLTACRLVPISLDIFVMIMKTSVSYYFLLETLNEN